jgi:hypothetical protein
VKVIQGRFAEARVYWAYALALLRPGVEVPLFAAPATFTGDIHKLDGDDLKVVVEEGRRQLDRQLADLEHNKSRAGTLLTLSVGEIAALSATAQRTFQHGLLLIVAWVLSALLAVLAAAGGASLLTSQARFGRLDTPSLAAGRRPALRNAALTYARWVGIGEETVKTRITVLRDGVLLAVLAALLYAVIWPFASTPDGPAGKSSTPSPSGAVTCPSTCTPSSPNPSMTKGTAPTSPSPATTTPAPSTPSP